MRRQAAFSDPRLLGEFTAKVMECSLQADFGQRVVDCLAELIPGVVVSLDEIHARSGTYQLAHTLPETEATVARAVGRLKEVFWQSPIHRYMDGPGQERLLDLREIDTTTALERTDFYQDVLKPLTIEHQIALRLDRPGWTCTLTLNRDNGFEPELKQFLNHAAPALIAAHRVACEVRRLRTLAGDVVSPPLPAALTPREWEVLCWMREGKRNSEISLILECSVRTVEKHVENILRKTGAETRAAALRLLPGH